MSASFRSIVFWASLIGLINSYVHTDDDGGGNADVDEGVDVLSADVGAPSSVACGVHVHVAAAVAAAGEVLAVRPRSQLPHTRWLHSDPFALDQPLVCHSRPVQQLAMMCLRPPPAPPGRRLQPLPLLLSC